MDYDGDTDDSVPIRLHILYLEFNPFIFHLLPIRLRLLGQRRLPRHVDGDDEIHIIDRCRYSSGIQRPASPPQTPMLVNSP